MAFDPKNPDASLLVLFKPYADKNPAKSAAAGRPIFDDYDVCEIRLPGSRNVGIYPALSRSHWHNDPITGEQVEVTYAQRFAAQWKQYKEHEQQTKTGTPLTYATFLTEGKRAELRALNIYTIEALAHIDGQELKNLGQGGRDMKNKAEDYLAQSNTQAPLMQIQAELEAVKARNQSLEEDYQAMKLKLASGEAQFEVMATEALREFIASNTGVMPQGNSNRKTLIRMAMDCRPKAAA